MLIFLLKTVRYLAKSLSYLVVGISTGGTSDVADSKNERGRKQNTGETKELGKNLTWRL